MYNLFLDDIREPANDGLSWIIVRNYSQFVKTVTEKGLPAYISFDNDLGEECEGYDCAKWLVDYCLDNNLTPDFKFYVHSQNSVAVANINTLINNFKDFKSVTSI